MSTFCAVDDDALINLIKGASKRIVFIAPGVYEPVANALKQRSEGGMFAIDITVILDTDEEVYRIGYGSAEGLKLLGDLAKSKGEKDFVVRNQPGLRVGVLLADEKMMVWSPTPRSVEEPPNSETTPSSDRGEESAPTAPNGLLLMGADPGEQVAQAVAADGTKTDPRQTEIGRSAITPEQVEKTISALERNPPIDVDLARITRAYSSKLQFVELKVKRAKLSKMQLTVSSHLLNADVKIELQGLIEAKLMAFAALRAEEVEVPAFLNGERSCDTSGKQTKDKKTEASLERVRHDIETKFFYNISGFGQLIAREDKIDFLKHLNAYKIQLMAHSKELRKRLDQKAIVIIEEVLDLITARATRATTGGSLPNRDKLRDELKKSLDRAKDEKPDVSWIFKDVTYEQTKDRDFRDRVQKELIAHGRDPDWVKHFKVVQGETPKPQSTMKTLTNIVRK